MKVLGRLPPTSPSGVTKSETSLPRLTEIQMDGDSEPQKTRSKVLFVMVTIGYVSILQDVREYTVHCSQRARRVVDGREGR